MKKILIVDDEPLMLRVIKSILSDRYEIVCASSGAEAMELFDLEHPDLVLSDLRMPEMDGYELHRRLQEKSEEPAPFIFMTADESDESESKGFEIGAADYIRKPAKAAVLQRRIANIMQNLDRIRGLKVAASTDQMTKLLNKSTAQREIGALCQRVPGVLMMIDLDSFKLVNDIHGHSMGDRILVRFAELVRGMVRSTDLVGRIGGDEFIAYLQHVKDEQVVMAKGAYLNEQLMLSAKEYMGEDMDISLGVSIGAIFSPGEGADFSELCKKADQALYTVKSRGKHGVAFYEAPKAESREEPAGKGLSRIRKILAERNPDSGAYLLDFDRFQAVYRFLSRLGDKHHQHIQLVQFTLRPESPEEEEAPMQFRDMLLHTLRHSDCVLQSGPLQFFVLLVGAGAGERSRIEERIREEWASIPASVCCAYDCEMESMGE